MQPLDWIHILFAMAARFLPVWIGLAVFFAVLFGFRHRIDWFGRITRSRIGMIGLGLTLFWLLTAVFAGQIVTHAALEVIPGLKNARPGAPLPAGAHGYPYYLLGGDNLARDVFSRMVMGAREVMKIAPAAAGMACLVGIALGLPAGYYGGRYDTCLSFVTNLIMSFPVILLFYLLVTPEIIATALPQVLAALLLLLPLLFLLLLGATRYRSRPRARRIALAATLLLGIWTYSGLVFNADPTGLLSMTPNVLIVFVSVVFVNAPLVARIVRGLTMDIRNRDYVAAAVTRGESPAYIMLWEILPNTAGPLVVDFCLRIGFTIILLGTLGFFGLGVSPESPDWGSTINEGRRLLLIYPHPALPPAIALLSLVLGLNLLADGLRETVAR